MTNSVNEEKNNSIQQTYSSYSKAALVFAGNNQIEDALAAYKKITELDPSGLPAEAQAQIQYANGYIKINAAINEGELEPAIELLGKILKFRAEDPMARSFLAALNDKIDRMPVSIQTYQTLGDAFFKNNMLDKARDMFTKITDIDPHNPAVRLHMAQVHLKQGSQSEAKKEYLNLAEEAYAKANFDEAFDMAQKAIELKSVEARYISGSIYFKRGKFEEAVVEFETLLRFKVNHLGALIQLGKSLDMLGRVEKAIATFQKALAIDNENPEVQEAWIEFCIRIKDIDKAIPNMKALLEKAVTGNNAERVAKFGKLMLLLEPDNVSTHVKLIDALQTLGDPTGTSEALYHYAILLERKKHLPEAIQCLERALVLSPANAHIIEKALARLNQKDPVVDTSAVPKMDDPIFLKLSDVWGDVDAPSAQSTGSTSGDPMALVDVCVQQGYLKAAIEICQQILETAPASENVRKKLAEVSSLYIKKLTGSK